MTLTLIKSGLIKPSKFRVEPHSRHAFQVVFWDKKQAKPRVGWPLHREFAQDCLIGAKARLPRHGTSEYLDVEFK